MSVCPPSAEYNKEKKRCVCKSGYYPINGYCRKCKENEVFENGECVCAKDYYLINGVCGKCASDEVYVPST